LVRRCQASGARGAIRRAVREALDPRLGVPKEERAKLGPRSAEIDTAFAGVQSLDRIAFCVTS